MSSCRLGAPALLFEITARCDRTCPHCYNIWRHDRSYAPTDLSLPDTLRLLDLAVASYGPPSVTILGGEPLLDSRTYEAAAHLTEAGVPVALSTHGGHLDLASARHLARSGVRTVEVSFCSDSGDGSSLSPASRALTLLESLGICATVSLVLARPFLPQLLDLARRALAFGAAGIVLQPLFEPFQGSLPSELIPSQQEAATSVASLLEWGSKAGIQVVLSEPSSCQTHPRLAIDPQGNLRRCEQSPRVLGSVLACNPPKLQPCSIKRCSFLACPPPASWL